MSFSPLQSSKDGLGNLLSTEQNQSEEVYEAVVEEQFSRFKEYSDIGHLHSERNTPQYSWYKGSRDRGLRGNISA